MSVPVGILLGLALAVSRINVCAGIAIYRTIFSSTVADVGSRRAVILLHTLNPAIGLLNLLARPRAWHCPPLAIEWALVAGRGPSPLCRNLGISFSCVGGVAGRSDELLEAARVDGAGTWSRFRNVTLPLLSPTLFFAAVGRRHLHSRRSGRSTSSPRAARTSTRTCCVSHLHGGSSGRQRHRQSGRAGDHVVRDHARADARATSVPRTPGAV